MYNDDLTRAPVDEADMWRLFKTHLRIIEDALLDTAVETREEALAPNSNAEALAKRGGGAALNIIRYRGVSDDYDQRDYFLQMGIDLLPLVTRAIEEKEMSPGFVHNWGMAMFCHGFVASHLFDDSDVLGPQRGGIKAGEQRSKKTQKKWLAHVLLHLMKQGKTREAAENAAVAIIRGIIKGGEFSAGFDAKWYEAMISYDELVSTYDNKHFSRKTMIKLAAEPVDDIPPLPDGIL